MALSLLGGVLVIVILETFLRTFFIVFGLTWLVYFMIRFVNRGFVSKK